MDWLRRWISNVPTWVSNERRKETGSARFDARAPVYVVGLIPETLSL